MKLPFVVAPDLSPRHVERYHRHIDSDASGWHRRFTESIWRRHQHPRNAALSGWRGPEDRQRRIVHFYDEYGLAGGAFVLRHPYLRLDLTLPEEAIAAYQAAIDDGLRAGGWSRAGAEGAAQVFRRGDLLALLTARRVHPEDERRGQRPPPNYRNLDVCVRGRETRAPAGWAERPFQVFYDVGLREVLPRGAPRLSQAHELAEHLPAQVELGCGPSIEAGIPHLSTLHRIYGVSRADYSFVFRAADDGLLTLFRDPEAKYAEMTDIYRACLLAPSTPVYDALAALHRRGHLVGPIITNNFDCQCAALGLPERSLRCYDWGPYYPVIPYDPRARSLLVIGVHADRRLVQMRARAAGLRVLFVDPEAYVGPDGRPIPYPLEAPQDQDLLVRATAHEAILPLARALIG